MPQGGNGAVGLLDQAPAALGLQLQLVPQRRELFDQIDQPEISRRLHWVGARARLEIVRLVDLGACVFEPVAKPIENGFDVGLVVHGESAHESSRSTGSRRSRSRACRSAVIDSNERVLRLEPEKLFAQPVGRIAKRGVGRVDRREPLRCLIRRERADELEIAPADLSFAGIRRKVEDAIRVVHGGLP